MNSRLLTAAGVVLLCAMAGAWRAAMVWDGNIFVSETYLRDGDVRVPAAANRKPNEYSQFQGEPLKLRSVKRLIDEADVVTQDGKVGIGLGNFVTRTEKGRSRLACDLFDRIFLKFEAEGQAESGTKPTMHLDAPCTTSSDLTRIETIWVPFARLREDNPRPASGIDASYGDYRGVYYRFSKMTSNWPAQWSLVAIRLYREGANSQDLSIEREQISAAIDKPFIINSK